MNKYPLISVIIATYNSERILPSVLESLNRQTYPQKKTELLVVDGGSTDNTRNLAKYYGCRVINNPKTIPVWAKYIGYASAKGKYVMYLDSDEVISDNNSIERKIALLQKYKDVHAVTGSGYKSPPGYTFVNQYINEFGDPFSFFIYRLSKDYRFFIESMRNNYHVVEENNNEILFNFADGSKLPIFELVAMGSIVDIAYLKKNFPEIVRNPSLIAHFFHLLVSKGSHIAVIKRDPLIHYSSDSPWKYLGKITSRIVSNIFTPAKEGFTGRNEFAHGSARYKKYLFLPYVFSIVFPFIDALCLTVTRKNPGYLVHVPLCLYTASLIVYYTGLKLLGFRPALRSYGQAKPIAP